jgi:acetyltransferase-like isoleucine patch superfamily enzyme
MRKFSNLQSDKRKTVKIYLTGVRVREGVAIGRGVRVGLNVEVGKGVTLGVNVGSRQAGIESTRAAGWRV